MDSALPLQFVFQESEKDDPRGSFHLCVSNDCVSIWAEVVHTRSKIRASLAFCQPLLFVSAPLFPELPPGFRVSLLKLCEGSSASSLVVRGWYGDRRVQWRTFPHGMQGTMCSCLAAAREPLAFTPRVIHTVRGKQQCRKGQTTCSCWVAEVLERWMDLMWQGVLENPCTE